MKRQNWLLGLAAAATACGGGSNGATNLSPADPGVTRIHQVQGAGASSPLVGQTVVVEGVVTGDFQDNDTDKLRNLGGFFVQDSPDGDAATSDGVFVFDGNDPLTGIDVGDLVRVTGVVNEHFGETQIKSNSVAVIGDGVITPLPVTLPAADTLTNSDGELIADLEHLEGMLVRFPQTLTVTRLYSLERFGEVGLAAGGRPYQFTNRSAPDAAGYAAHREALAARFILLDDGRRNENPTPVTLLTASADPDYSLRGGDEIVDLAGNIRFARGSGGKGDEMYRVMATIDPEFVASNPPPQPPAIAGDLRVVSFNTLNFFSTVDAGQDNCGPGGDQGCRGADSAKEFDRQRSKLAHALSVIDADIIGLVEIENNGGAALQSLVDALNDVSTRSYAYVDAGFVGDDVITVGFLYDSAAVDLAGSATILDATVDARFNDDKNRPALAQAFQQQSNGALVSVVVNHLKSKGSNCDDIGDRNRRDGQGNCNATRTAAAEALADWVAQDPTGSGDPDYLIIGDLNAYVFEDPLSAFKAAGLTSLLETNSAADAYSFTFDGQLGALDHALATATLAPQVAGVEEWHINADEPPLRDYNLEFDREPALFDPDSPLRTSDHDPVIIGLDLEP